MSARRWNKLAGARLAGSGLPDSQFNVTLRLDWWSASSANYTSGSSRFLNSTPGSGNSKVTGTVHCFPFDGTITNWNYKAGIAGNAGSGTFNLRVNGVNVDPMTVPANTNAKEQACSVAVVKGDRINVLHTGTYTPTLPQQIGVSCRIERT